MFPRPYLRECAPRPTVDSTLGAPHNTNMTTGPQEHTRKLDFASEIADFVWVPQAPVGMAVVFGGAKARDRKKTVG